MISKRLDKIGIVYCYRRRAKGTEKRSLAQNLVKPRVRKVRNLILNNIFNMLLGNSLRLTRGTNSTWSTETTLRCSLAVLWTAQALHGRDHAAWGHWDLQILRRCGNDFLWEIGDMDSACLVLIAFGNDLYNDWSANRLNKIRLSARYLNDFISRELEEGDIGSITGHQIPI